MKRTCLFIAALIANVLMNGCSSQTVGREEWTTMGTVAAVQWKGEETPDVRQAIGEVREIFRTIETLLNAHDESSELRQLAKCSDAEILSRCDPRVRSCYEAAFRMRDETEGVFNPRWRGPATMDLGAIAKGFAVDVAAEACSKRNTGALLIDLGGNLKCVHGSWKTGITDPNRIDDILAETFSLGERMASATSGEYHRGHHIRDGRTGNGVNSGVSAVTVVHPNSALLADGLSTTLFLLGKEKGTAFVTARYPEAKVYWTLQNGERDK